MTISVAMTVNGKAASGKVEARTLLVQFLREHLGMTGTHVGCDTSQCGACVVHVDGKSVKSCTMLAVQAEGASVLGRGAQRAAQSLLAMATGTARAMSARVSACRAVLDGAGRLIDLVDLERRIAGLEQRRGSHGDLQ